MKLSDLRKNHFYAADEEWAFIEKYPHEFASAKSIHEWNAFCMWMVARGKDKRTASNPYQIDPEGYMEKFRREDFYNELVAEFEAAPDRYLELCGEIEWDEAKGFKGWERHVERICMKTKLLGKVRSKAAQSRILASLKSDMDDCSFDLAEHLKT